METLTQVVEQPELDVTVFDSCDRCGTHVAAFGLAFKDGALLHFCGHCLNKYSPTLGANGWTIVDRTDRINEKPMSGIAGE